LLTYQHGYAGQRNLKPLFGLGVDNQSRIRETGALKVAQYPLPPEYAASAIGHSTTPDFTAIPAGIALASQRA
jgi:hypothetical protein